MVQQVIDVGVEANDGSGDSLYEAGNKINQNFTELYLKDSDGIIDKAELQAAMNASDSFGSFKSAILAL